MYDALDYSAPAPVTSIKSFVTKAQTSVAKNEAFKGNVSAITCDDVFISHFYLIYFDSSSQNVL